MKETVRRGVFETNSSSVHSITMCSGSEFDAWKNGDALYDRELDSIILIKDIPKKDYIEELEFLKKCEKGETDKWGRPCREEDKRFLTYENFFNDWDYIEYETFSSSHETPSGDTVIAFGYYGHD